MPRHCIYNSLCFVAGADRYRFVVTFFILTYLLNRPCVYCSALLLILFVSSCYWSDRCLLPNSLPHATDWLEPIGYGHSEEGSYLVHAVNETATALASAVVEDVKHRLALQHSEWTGVGAGWMRNWLGARQWRVPCVDVYVRL